MTNIPHTARTGMSIGGIFGEFGVMVKQLLYLIEVKINVSHTHIVFRTTFSREKNHVSVEFLM